MSVRCVATIEALWLCCKHDSRFDGVWLNVGYDEELGNYLKKFVAILLTLHGQPPRCRCMFLQVLDDGRLTTGQDVQLALKDAIDDLKMPAVKKASALVLELLVELFLGENSSFFEVYNDIIEFKPPQQGQPSPNRQLM